MRSVVVKNVKMQRYKMLKIIPEIIPEIFFARRRDALRTSQQLTFLSSPREASVLNGR